MKLHYLIPSLVFIPLLTMNLACNSNNAAPSAPVTIVFQQPGGGAPTPTPVQAPVTFMIWQNDTAGCYQGNCLLNQVNIGGQGPTTVSGLNLEFDSPSYGPYYSLQFDSSTASPIDASAYQYGHLQMDIKLGTPASVGGISVQGYGSGFFYNLNMALLSNSSFTHVSIPIDLYQYNYLPNSSTTSYAGYYFNMYVNSSGGPFPYSVPLLYVNNIEWTSN